MGRSHLLPDELPREHTGDIAVISASVHQIGEMHNVSAFALLVPSYSQKYGDWEMFQWSTHVLLCAPIMYP